MTAWYRPTPAVTARRLGLPALFCLLTILHPGVPAAGLDTRARIERPVRLVDALSVNASNSERFVAYDKCEQEGVREIAKLLERSKIEEMWAFLPRGRASGTCEWHEVGRNEQSGTDEAYVDVDWAYLESLMAAHRAADIYHFHPLVFFDYASASTEERRKRDFARAIVSDLKFSMPSPADIHFMMEITSRFHQRRPQGGAIGNAVVTPYGIVDYALTVAGRVKYDSDKDARTQGLYIKYVAASALDDARIEAIIAEHPDDVARSMKRLAESLNTQYLRVVFQPGEENQ